MSEMLCSRFARPAVLIALALLSFAAIAPDVPAWRRRLLCDPATSGGLLAALEPAAAGELPGTVVGRLVEGTAGAIAVC